VLLKRRKRKKVKEDPNLVANGRFKCLVAPKEFQCLVALGRFQCLMALGRRRKNILFTSSHFPPTNFTFFFSIDLKVLLYHGFRPLLTPFLPFFCPTNYNHTS
jgi:hypothetical protein